MRRAKIFGKPISPQKIMPITLSDFYKNKFGRKVYKLAVDAGCTCPTRDGRLDTRGCVFCSANGSGDFMPPKNLSIAEQLESAKLLVQKKAYGRGGPRFGDPNALGYDQNFSQANDCGGPCILGVEKVSAEEKSLQGQKAAAKIKRIKGGTRFIRQFFLHYFLSISRIVFKRTFAPFQQFSSGVYSNSQ